jgi:hypothetical protein
MTAALARMSQELFTHLGEEDALRDKLADKEADGGFRLLEIQQECPPSPSLETAKRTSRRSLWNLRR